MINYGNEKLILNEEDILYVATVPSQKNLLLVKYLDQELLVPGKLRSLKASIKSPYFIKSLKSFVLNTNKIERLYIAEGAVEFIDQTVLELGVAGTRKIQSFLKAEGSYVAE
nr:LytTR family transcriptional regulator DNA-binding domain-containing protein [Enterococcus sp. 665A]